MIKGYRDLSQAEIDLMNEIKEEGVRLESLIAKVDSHVQSNTTEGHTASTNPNRWVSIARTDLQTGLMALTRAVAKPGFF
jgi:hypothetical protein